MRCPTCKAENQAAAKFCVECGTAFHAPCTKCGFDNPPGAKFCQECGASFKHEPASSQVAAPVAVLGKSASEERPALQPDQVPEGERKIAVQEGAIEEGIKMMLQGTAAQRSSGDIVWNR